MHPMSTRVVRMHRSKEGRILQNCDVYIGRACQTGGWNLSASKWQNPYRLQDYNHDRTRVLNLYRKHILSRPDLLAALPELQGKTLGCWCHFYCPDTDGPRVPFCHGDILMELLREQQSKP